MNAAEVDLLATQAAAFGEPRHGRKIAREQKDARGPLAPAGNALAGLLDAVELGLDAGRQTEQIEFLLPVRRGEIIVDHDDHVGVQVVAPAHDDLAVDEAFIHPKQHDRHGSRTRQAHTRWRRGPSPAVSARAPAAAARAA